MSRLRKGKLRFLRGQKGLSLLEVVVAVGILGFIGASVLLALDTNARASRTLDEQVIAANLVTNHIETIKQCPFAPSYPSDNCSFDSIAIPNQYIVTIDTECSTDGENFGACTGSANETFQKIIVSVSWEGGDVVLSICSYRCKR